MDKPSPFTPGYGTRPPYLAGREAEQSLFMEALARLKGGMPNRGLVMYGPRGMGKTVLLRWLEEQCQKDGIAPIYTTPAMSLHAFEDLPRLLLPQGWLPDKVTLGLGSILTAQWDIKDAGGSKQPGTLADHLARACRSQPRALLLDEAHTLQDERLYQALLGLAQHVADQAPFLLVLTGTPGLMPHLLSVGATFVGRAGEIGVGALSPEAASDAIRIPLQEEGIAIQADALAAIAEDCQRYPFFLQEWGGALWHVIQDERQLREVTPAQIAAADKAFQQKKASFYGKRYQAMQNNTALLAAADAVSKRFQGKERLNPDELTIHIARSLADIIPDEKDRHAKAVELKQELNRLDYFWHPPDGDTAAPGIPSFMTYISERYAQQQALNA